MPSVAYQTPTLDDGSANPNVAVGMVAIQASGLPDSAAIAVTTTIDGAVASFSGQADASGNLAMTVPFASPVLGSGGSWQDNGTAWVAGAGDALLTIALTP